MHCKGVSMAGFVKIIKKLTKCATENCCHEMFADLTVLMQANVNAKVHTLCYRCS